jgi:hypothetical protein
MHWRKLDVKKWRPYCLQRRRKIVGMGADWQMEGVHQKGQKTRGGPDQLWRKKRRDVANMDGMLSLENARNA